MPATTEQLLDFDFYPWEKTVVATAGRDGIVKVWKIPADGQLAMDLVAAEYYLAGHEKKVDLLKFHPTAADLLLSASSYALGMRPRPLATNGGGAADDRAQSPPSGPPHSDLTLRLWDFREMREIQTLEGLDEPTVSMAWSLYGATILQASKNGAVNLYDPRAKASPVHVGPQRTGLPQLPGRLVPSIYTRRPAGRAAQPAAPGMHHRLRRRQRRERDLHRRRPGLLHHRL